MSGYDPARGRILQLFNKELDAISAKHSSGAHFYPNAAKCREELLISMANYRDETQRVTSAAELHVLLMDTRKYTLKSQQALKERSQQPSERPYPLLMVASFLKLDGEPTDPLFIPMMDRIKLVSSRITDIDSLFIPSSNPRETAEQWRNIDLTSEVPVASTAARVAAPGVAVPSGATPARTRPSVLDGQMARPEESRLTEPTHRVKQEPPSQDQPEQAPPAQAEIDEEDRPIRLAVPLLPPEGWLTTKREPTPTTQFKDDDDDVTGSHDIVPPHPHMLSNSSAHAAAAAAAPATTSTAHVERRQPFVDAATRSARVKEGKAKAKDRTDAEAKRLLWKLGAQVSRATGGKQPGNTEYDAQLQQLVTDLVKRTTADRKAVSLRRNAIVAEDNAVNPGSDTDVAKLKRAADLKREKAAYKVANAAYKEAGVIKELMQTGQYVHILKSTEDEQANDSTTDTEDETDGVPGSKSNNGAEMNDSIAALLETKRAVLDTANRPNPSVAALVASRPPVASSDMMDTSSSTTTSSKKGRQHPQDGTPEAKKPKAVGASNEDEPPPLMNYSRTAPSSASALPPMMMNNWTGLQQQPPPGQSFNMGHFGMMGNPLGAFNPNFSGNAYSMPPMIASASPVAAATYSTPRVMAAPQYQMALVSAVELDRRLIQEMAKGTRDHRILAELRHHLHQEVSKMETFSSNPSMHSARTTEERQTIGYMRGKLTALDIMLAQASALL